MEERKNWRKHLKKKQKERKEEEELELKNLRNETEVWKFINKKRRRKEEIPNKITKEE